MSGLTDHRQLSFALNTALAMSVLAMVGGCGRADRASPQPAAPATTSVASSEWRSDYSPGQLAVYDEAVQRASDYEKDAQAFFAAGKATPEAKEFFQQNLMTWQVRWADLESYERQGIKIARAPTVISSRAITIDLLKNGAAEVAIRRCVDATDLGGTIKGEPLPESTDRPVIQRVDAHKFADGSWRFGTFETTDKPCGG